MLPPKRKTQKELSVLPLDFLVTYIKKHEQYARKKFKDEVEYAYYRSKFLQEAYEIGKIRYKDAFDNAILVARINLIPLACKQGV